MSQTTSTTAEALLERARTHLAAYRTGSGSGLDSDQCVNAAWYLRRDLEDLLPVVEQLLATQQPEPQQRPLTLARQAA